MEVDDVSLVVNVSTTPRSSPPPFVRVATATASVAEEQARLLEGSSRSAAEPAASSITNHSDSNTSASTMTTRATNVRPAELDHAIVLPSTTSTGMNDVQMQSTDERRRDSSVRPAVLASSSSGVPLPSSINNGLKPSNEPSKKQNRTMHKKKRSEVSHRDQAPPTPESTSSSSFSSETFTAIPSFITEDPLTSESDSSASEDEFGRPKSPKAPKLDSLGRIRPRPSYYYDADYDPNHFGGDGIKKRGRRGGLKGVPVFEPTMQDFEGHGGFYGYVKRIEKYGMRSGIAKVIPPKEWTDALPSTTEKLRDIRLREPIEQIMMGQQGLYRVTNVAKTRIWNAAQWKQMAEQPKWAPPDFKKEAEKGDRTDRKPEENGVTPKRRRKGANGIAGDEADTEGEGPSSKSSSKVKDGDAPETPRQTRSGTRFGSDVKKDGPAGSTSKSGSKDVTPSGSPSSRTRRASVASTSTPAHSESTKIASTSASATKSSTVPTSTAPKTKRATNLQRAEPTDEEWEAFIAKYTELPHGMKKEDYTVELMRDIERRYWRTLSFGEAPMYGADMNGSIFSDETKAWNVAHLGDLLPKLAPTSCQIPGVVSPYLYFGMWRATFAWHVEDADLYSINYIHFGAPKFWYSVPQEQSDRFERVMEGYFQQDRTKCPQFLRHKAFLASPRVLAGSNITLNRCMQLPGEFILTYPKGYHSGFNLGFNCAESINFATERWLPLGKVAKSCYCIGDSVSIDVDVWLTEAARAEAEARGEVWPPPRKTPPTPPPEEERMSSLNGQQASAVINVPLVEAAPSSSGRKRMYSAKAASELPQPSAASTSSSATSSGNSAASSSALPPRKKFKVMAGADHERKSLAPLPYPCALCPERSTDGLVKIGEVAGRKMAAHRVCVMFTPATWIETDEDSGEEVVKGFLDIEKARWKLKCQLCDDRHGTKVQCTKGKCPKAMHVTCGLRVDSGGFLDAKLDGASLLHQTGPEVAEPVAASSSRSDPASPADPTVEALAAKGEDPSTSAAPPPPASTEIELTILCRQHNPAWQKIEAERKADELKARVAALPPRARLLVRTVNGTFDVTYLENVPNKTMIRIMFDDGKRSEARWKAICWPESPEALKRKAEIAAKVAEDKANYDRAPMKKRPTFAGDGAASGTQSMASSSAAAPYPHPYSGHTYPHTSSAAAYQQQRPSPGYYYAPAPPTFGPPPNFGQPAATASHASYPPPAHVFRIPNAASFQYPSHPTVPPVPPTTSSWSPFPPSMNASTFASPPPYQPFPVVSTPSSGWGAPPPPMQASIAPQQQEPRGSSHPTAGPSPRTEVMEIEGAPSPKLQSNRHSLANLLS